MEKIQLSISLGLKFRRSFYFQIETPFGAANNKMNLTGADEIHFKFTDNLNKEVDFTCKEICRGVKSEDKEGIYLIKTAKPLKGLVMSASDFANESFRFDPIKF